MLLFYIGLSKRLRKQGIKGNLRFKAELLLLIKVIIINGGGVSGLSLNKLLN